MFGLVGSHADVESIVALRDLLFKVRAKTEHVFVNVNSEMNQDFRGSYLMNSSVAGVEMSDCLLIIGCNPRLEIPVFNARIRKCVVNNGLEVGLIGAPDRLTYDYTHLGTTDREIDKLL